MEMRPIDDIDIGRDLTPSLSPLAFSLYDSSLVSHCSACFSPLSPPPHQFSPLLPSSPINSHHAPNPSILYCSPQCSNSDSDLHVSSAEHHLPHQQSHPTSCHLGGDTSDVRVALRLLHLFEKFHLISRPNERRLERIGGLMSNRDKLMSIENEEDGDILAKIRNGGRVMVSARRMRDGLDLDFSGDCLLEEAVLCLVLTNAVEVQVNGGRTIGIAVYDTTFSWINHSCSPNACYRFSLQENSQGSGDSPLWITPAATNTFDEIEAIHYGVCNKGGLEYGPRVILRSIKAIKKSEEVSIAYTDLLQAKAMRQLELWLKYRFICCCRRCDTWPSTYVDHCLQEISAVNLNCTNLSSDHNFYRDEAIRMLIDYVDDAKIRTKGK
ncbi:hypothetical protein F0562_027502 [Nyssa sinensis]|uniref:SET domain-containing protein n=1 Tax=Nyssa sinensis TaxID=561372 RepID=A0A5J5B5I2_9ASTE|nr:hypothetical protein F0562_027502 [Nyssa sinensis]